MSHKAWISAAGFELGVGARKKDRTGQEKATKGLYFTYLGRSPHSSDLHQKLCIVGDLLHVITCSKFQNEIFRGYDFTGGRIYHFPIDFWMGLTTVQRYCAACDTATLQTGQDRQTGQTKQRSDSQGRTVLQMVAQKRVDRSLNTAHP